MALRRIVARGQGVGKVCKMTPLAVQAAVWPGPRAAG